MSGEGILINAAISLAAGGLFFVAAAAALKSRRSAVTVFLSLLGIVVAMAGIRQLAVFASLRIPSAASFDLALYLVGLVPGALSMAPLSYLAARVLSGSRRVALGVALGYVFVGLLGVVVLYTGGVAGPYITAWGGEWAPRSIVGRIMIFTLMFIPALVAGFLLAAGGKLQGGEDGRRLLLVGWATMVCYAAFTADALGVEGVGLLWVRLAMLGAGALAFHAYASEMEPAEPVTGGADPVGIGHSGAFSLQGES